MLFWLKHCNLLYYNVLELLLQVPSSVATSFYYKDSCFWSGIPLELSSPSYMLMRSQKTNNGNFPNSSEATCVKIIVCQRLVFSIRNLQEWIGQMRCAKMPSALRFSQGRKDFPFPSRKHGFFSYHWYWRSWLWRTFACFSWWKETGASPPSLARSRLPSVSSLPPTEELSAT